jgi:hypothetical protein
MRTHFHWRFCCDLECAKHEIKKLVDAMDLPITVVDMERLEVCIPGVTWIFNISSSEYSDSIRGRIIDSWDACKNAYICQGAKRYLTMHTGKFPKGQE